MKYLKITISIVLLILTNVCSAQNSNISMYNGDMNIRLLWKLGSLALIGFITISLFCYTNKESQKQKAIEEERNNLLKELKEAKFNNKISESDYLELTSRWITKSNKEIRYLLNNAKRQEKELFSSYIPEKAVG
jgi:hypothetical protein